jgi:hypothetical protein
MSRRSGGPVPPSVPHSRGAGRPVSRVSRKRAINRSERPAGVSALARICYSFVMGFELIDAFRKSGRERTRPDPRLRPRSAVRKQEGTPEGIESLISMIRTHSRAGADIVTQCHRGRRARKLVAACRWKPGPDYLSAGPVAAVHVGKWSAGRDAGAAPVPVKPQDDTASGDGNRHHVSPRLYTESDLDWRGWGSRL